MIRRMTTVTIGPDCRLTLCGPRLASAIFGEWPETLSVQFADESVPILKRVLDYLENGEDCNSDPVIDPFTGKVAR